MTKSISLETLKERLSNGKAPVLLEALPARHFLDGHLPGALHMPHERVAELAPVVVPDKQADVVVYCASATCRNSHQAADSLARLGYGNVEIFAGGKEEWLAAGFSFERGGTAH